jgi:hypothetical protein
MHAQTTGWAAFCDDVRELHLQLVPHKGRTWARLIDQNDEPASDWEPFPDEATARATLLERGTD